MRWFQQVFTTAWEGAKMAESNVVQPAVQPEVKVVVVPVPRKKPAKLADLEAALKKGK